MSIIGKLLTVCIVTKNEAGFVGQAVRSARDYGIPVNVLDTGSIDQTVDIARQAGAAVSSIGRSDGSKSSMAEWRNELTKNASTTWILHLDADERLFIPCMKDAIAELIQEQTAAHLIRTYSETYTWMNIRLIPSASRYQFDGELHESYQIASPSPSANSISVLNVRTDHRSALASTYRDLEYYSTLVSPETASSRDCYHYGRALVASGRAADALPWIEERIRRRFKTVVRKHSTLMLLGHAALQLNDPFLALDAYQRSNSAYEDFPETECLLGELALLDDDAETARKYFKKALHSPLVHMDYFLKQNLACHNIARQRLFATLTPGPRNES